MEGVTREVVPDLGAVIARGFAHDHVADLPEAPGIVLVLHKSAYKLYGQLTGLFVEVVTLLIEQFLVDRSVLSRTDRNRQSGKNRREYQNAEKKTEKSQAVFFHFDILLI